MTRQCSKSTVCCQNNRMTTLLISQRPWKCCWRPGRDPTQSRRYLWKMIKHGAAREPPTTLSPSHAEREPIFPRKTRPTPGRKRTGDVGVHAIAVHRLDNGFVVPRILSANMTVIVEPSQPYISWATFVYVNVIACFVYASWAWLMTSRLSSPSGIVIFGDGLLCPCTCERLQKRVCLGGIRAYLGACSGGRSMVHPHYLHRNLQDNADLLHLSRRN
jgi:hypothetical protein